MTYTITVKFKSGKTKTYPLQADSLENARKTAEALLGKQGTVIDVTPEAL